MKLSRRLQKSRAIVDKYLNQITENELQKSPHSRIERKRTSLIASLVSSLQEDEKIETIKTEEDQKGNMNISLTSNSRVVLSLD